MSAHRYWRLVFYNRQVAGNYRMALAETSWRSAIGGPNVATGGTITANTAEGGFPASNLLDANAATLYSVVSSVAGVWIYDFGGPVEIVEVAVTLGGAASTYPGSVYAPEAIRIDYSDDFSVWVPASTTVSAPGGWVDGATEVVAIAPQVVRMGTPAGGHLSLGAVLDQGLAVAAGGVGGTADLVDGGALRIAGTVAIDGTPITPVRRRVRLFHQLSGRLVRETWSGLDGSFAFEGLAAEQYMVITDDHTMLYDPVARDRRTPVP